MRCGSGVGDRRYDGVASFGRRPMFDVGTVLLEVFLFDFAGDLYGQMIDVAFIGWIRHELAFATIEELVRCMDEDTPARPRRLGAGRRTRFRRSDNVPDEIKER